MINETELQMCHIMPQETIPPYAPHPALVALQDVLENVRVAIQGSRTLPSYLEGALISIPMSSEQKIALDAQVRTLKGIERMIVERYPGVIE